MAPFYRNQIAADHVRLAEMTALREGRPWSPPDSPVSRLISAAALPGPDRERLLQLLAGR